MHKSLVMLQLCLDHGWKAEVETNAEETQVVYRVFALRGQETLVVEYHDTKLIRGDYTYGSNYKLKLNWKNQIVKLVEGKPDPKRLAGSTDIEEARYVPWTAESTDEEVLKSVVGCEIAWVRKFDGELLTGRIPVDREHKHLRLVHSKGAEPKRILEWADPFGFHAVHLDAIVQVS